MSLLQDVSLDYNHSLPAHLFDGLPNVALTKLHSATAVFQQMRLESQPYGIQGGRLHAIVGRQATDVDIGHALSFEVLAQSGCLTMAIVEEPAVAIDVRGGTLLEHPSDP